MERMEPASAEEILKDAIRQSSNGAEIANKLRNEARQQEELSARLEATARDIESVLGGTKTDELEDGVAGQAYQGQSGSSVVDVESAVRDGGENGSMVDRRILEDVKDHEREHEEQAPEWNAEEVDIGNGQTLSRHEISETGSMSVQSTIKFVSDDYKSIYGKVTGLVSATEAREVARSGDLEELGEEIRKRRGIEEEEYATAA